MCSKGFGVMKNYFHIVNGVIINVALFDENHQFKPEDGLWIADNGINGIGDSYNEATGEFIRHQTNATLVPNKISDRQFFQQLAIEGLITEEEAINAVKDGTLPQQFENLILSLPLAEQFNARMLLSGATEFQRYHPMVEAFRVYLNYEPEAVDQIWLEASKL